MKISLNVKRDNQNSYTDNVKLILEDSDNLTYLKIDDGREREIAVDSRELALAIRTLGDNAGACGGKNE